MVNTSQLGSVDHPRILPKDAYNNGIFVSNDDKYEALVPKNMNEISSHEQSSGQSKGHVNKNGYVQNGHASGYRNGYNIPPTNSSLVGSQKRGNIFERTARAMHWKMCLFYLFLPRRIVMRCFFLGSYIVLFTTLIYVLSETSYGAVPMLGGRIYDEFFMAKSVDLREAVRQELHNKTYKTPEMNNTMTYKLIMDNNYLCSMQKDRRQTIYLLWVIKSNANNSGLRNSIRKTWGADNLVPMVTTKRVFTLGAVHSKRLQKEIEEEQKEHGDIIQGDFLDAYYNNTLKLMTSFRWATTHCGEAKYIGFTDDDFFVPPYNILNILLSVPEMANEDFILGNVQRAAHPKRFRQSKWYISRGTYPFSIWPNYPVAGAFFLPMQTAKKIDAAFRYAKQLLFDDVLVGYLAVSLQIPLIHSDDIHLYLSKYPGLKYTYDNLIAVHGIKDPELMLQWWEVYNSLRLKKLWNKTVL